MEMCAQMEVLLASGSRDGSVRIWSLDKGHCVNTVNFPQQAKFRARPNQHPWVALVWCDRHSVAVSSFQGDVHVYNVGLAPPTSVSLPLGHKSLVFSVTPAFLTTG